MSHFEKGRREAEIVIERTPRKVAYWLERATRSRRRWTTLFFDRRKREFLDGFIAGLEAQLNNSEGPRREGRNRTPPPSDPPALDADCGA